jgi:hypothetical protein
VRGSSLCRVSSGKPNRARVTASDKSYKERRSSHAAVFAIVVPMPWISVLAGQPRAPGLYEHATHS